MRNCVWNVTVTTFLLIWVIGLRASIQRCKQIQFAVFPVDSAKMNYEAKTVK